MLSLTPIMPALDLLHVQYVFALCTLSTYLPVVVAVLCIDIQESQMRASETEKYQILHSVIFTTAAVSACFMAAYTSLVYDEYSKLPLHCRVCLILSPLLCVTTTFISICRGYLRTTHGITRQHMVSNGYVCLWDSLSFIVKCIVVILTVSTVVPQPKLTSLR